MIRALELGSEMTWRGGESQVEYLAQGLRAKGLEIAVAYPRGSAAIARLQDRLPILPLRSRHSWDPRVVADVARWCQEHSTQLIDAHSSKAHALAVAVKRRLPQVKVAVHRHIDNRPSDRLFTRRRYLGEGVDRFIAISEAIARVLVDYGVPRQRITVIHSATDPHRFTDADRPRHRAELRARLGAPEGAVVVGNASALTEQKGHDVLLEAVHLLREAQGLDVRLVLAGEGELRASLEQLTRGHGLQDRVTFLGFVEDVSGFLQGLDILAVPSNYEGLGTVILEGMLAGCPVVATSAGGIPEIVTHGETGLLSPIRDPAALARNISQLIAEPVAAQAMVACAQAKVRAEFSVERMVEETGRVYQQLVGTD